MQIITMLKRGFEVCDKSGTNKELINFDNIIYMKYIKNFCKTVNKDKTAVYDQALHLEIKNRAVNVVLWIYEEDSIKVYEAYRGFLESI